MDSMCGRGDVWWTKMPPLTLVWGDEIPPIATTNDVRAHTYTTTHSSSTRVSSLISGSQTHTEVLKGVTVTNSP